MKFKPQTSRTPRTLDFISDGKFVWLVLFVVILNSCSQNDNAPNIKDLANQWSLIESTDFNDLDFDSIDLFYDSLNQFKESEVFRLYNSIPFSQDFERTYGPLNIGQPISENREIEEIIENILEHTLIFKGAVRTKDLNTAKEASAEIAGAFVPLLIIDVEAQRYIASANLSLLITLMIFIILIVLFSGFLYLALNRSLKREDERIKFSRTYMLAQEEERLRISRELHDTVIQDLRYLLLETEKADNAAYTEKTSPIIKDLMKKSRTLCSELVPPDFRYSELPDALRQLCLDFSGKTGINCRAEIDENIKLDFLATEKRLQVFWIVQEALTNIEKHAEAKEAVVTMRRDKAQSIIQIGISDDGKGFIYPPDKIKPQQEHLGIVSMKERAAILGGTLKVITEPGEGALVCLEFPSYA